MSILDLLCPEDKELVENSHRLFAIDYEAKERAKILNYNYIEKTDYISETKKGNYFMVPNSFWKITIGSQARTVFLYLVSQPPKTYTSQKAISKAINLDKRNVMNSIKELELFNMIEKINRGDKDTRYSYNILPADKWQQATIVKPPKSGFFYIIKYPHGIKIGISANKKRVYERYNKPWQQKPQLIEIFTTTFAIEIEKLLKEKYSQDMISGSSEFLSPTVNIDLLIEEIQDLVLNYGK